MMWQSHVWSWSCDYVVTESCLDLELWLCCDRVMFFIQWQSHIWTWSCEHVVTDSYWSHVWTWSCNHFVTDSHICHVSYDRIVSGPGAVICDRQSYVDLELWSCWDKVILESCLSSSNMSRVMSGAVLFMNSICHQLNIIGNHNSCSSDDGIDIFMMLIWMIYMFVIGSRCDIGQLLLW